MYGVGAASVRRDVDVELGVQFSAVRVLLVWWEEKEPSSVEWSWWPNGLLTILRMDGL